MPEITPHLTRPTAQPALEAPGNAPDNESIATVEAWRLPEPAPRESERLLLAESDIAKLRCLRHTVYGCGAVGLAAASAGLIAVGGLAIAAAAKVGPWTLASSGPSVIGDVVVSEVSTSCSSCLVGSIGVLALGIGMTSTLYGIQLADSHAAARALEARLAPLVTPPVEQEMARQG